MSTFVALILTFGFQVAAEVKNPWDMWKQCPEKQKELATKLDEFDQQVEAHLAKLNEKERQKLFQRNNDDGALIKYIAPFLLPASPSAEVAQSCWSFYRDIKEGLESDDSISAREAADGWKSCLEAKYRKVPSHVDKILTCYNKL